MRQLHSSNDLQYEWQQGCEETMYSYLVVPNEREFWTWSRYPWELLPRLVVENQQNHQQPCHQQQQHSPLKTGAKTVGHADIFEHSLETSRHTGRRVSQAVSYVVIQ